MATKTDSPQVTALLKEAEKQFGRPLKGPTDFVLMADRIERKTREHISDSTIKRLWMPSLAYRTVSDRTLNVIAQYAGFEHFKAFQEDLAERGIIESELVTGENAVKAADLKVGDILSIAWMPNRECRLRYLGDRKFEAVECHNSTLQEGDTFFCSAFIPGRKLFVDHLTHGEEVFESYGMGTQHGLTRVELDSQD